ncbi:pilus assembly protein N-terminal domain-containing protein [Asticcacaulis sp. BYS171W]|uniref:Pilus assembly protein N-terminal domain-containing protein n=1 Tax=Asticcacaulis aquaticus TaxID=2984212 RepID=A0ABT5HYJ9_9CAUL|nr:pilus assembly protein N-terminal domain-containing protein [Asticcacaulis aquaticus]MDC7685156.1 pilus assembly protein N-terminal domain-containing protein [Asticcacaulis aquaticus]
MKTTKILVPLIGAVMMMAGAAQAGQKLIVEKDHTARVNLSAAAGSVIVGNPAIADVSVVDSRTIYIVGRGFGRSSVTVTDAAGRTIWDGEVTVGSPATGGVTIYKGLKPTNMVCSRVCVEQGEAAPGTSSEAVVQPAPAPAG